MIRPGPARESDHAVGQEHRLLDGVGDEQHGGALRRGDGGELLLQALSRHGIDGGERLVHQQHRRVVGQHARHGGALAHAARELVRILLLEALEADQIDEALRDRRALLPSARP